MTNENKVYSSTPITQEDLQQGYTIFGNKGNVWSGTAHIYKSSHGNLCGTPALSFNHAKDCGVTTAGCPLCIENYRKQFNTK